MKELYDTGLSEYSGFGCGGKAELLIEIENKDELEKNIIAFRESGKKWYLLGKGYNTLISDSGVKGAVLVLKGLFCKLSLDSDNSTIIAGSGTVLQKLLKYSIDNELEGFEFLAGIPGTVGGAVFNNVGTPEGGIGDMVKNIEVFNIEKKGYERISKEELDFGYRKSNIPRKKIITEVVFHLKTGNKTDIIKKIKDNYNLKNRKQPVNEKSCGCIFKNPADGQVSSAKLIEMAGLKGFSIGGAQVSKVHANYIINNNGATSKDIWDLIHHIRYSVKKEFNEDLELEINLLGEGFGV